MFFSQLNIPNWIKVSCTSLKYQQLTKIQELTIPQLLKNNSAIITSQTGSGKTLCYLIPILNKIVINNTTQVLIVLPTKELARQVYSKILQFRQQKNELRVGLAVGGNNYENTMFNFKKNPPAIIVGTVAKILEIISRKIVEREKINTLVLDEADMLLEQGFSNSTKTLFSFIDHPDLQKIACGATTHESLANQFSKYLKNTKVFSLTKTIWSNQQIIHNIAYSTVNSQPLKTLVNLMGNINPYFCIIFANTKNEANEIYDLISKNNPGKIGLLHKNLTPRQRKNMFRDINDNKFQYLVASDLVARGLDIQGADIIISMGLPEDDLWYMHRIGRAGRYKDTGTSFVVYKNGIDRMITRLGNKNINFHYYLVKNPSEMVEKPLKIHAKKHQMIDEETNKKIQQIIYRSDKKIQPCYKKRLAKKINKVKQKKRHEFIEKRIKRVLISKNIRDSKRKKYQQNGNN